LAPGTSNVMIVAADAFDERAATKRAV